MAKVRGGDKLAIELKKMAEKIRKANTVRVGFMEGATYPDGTSVPLVAAINEFGGKITVPERETTIYRDLDEKTGEFRRDGKFVKAAKSNFATTHTVPEHTITIPPRPYFRNMITEGEKHWADDLAKILPAVGYDTKAALGQMGDQMKGELQKSIRDLKTPKNAKSTIRKKGFDDPLIDSSHMINSVDYEVNE